MSRAAAEGLELEVRNVSEMYFEGSWFGSLTLLLPAAAGLPDSQWPLVFQTSSGQR